jgi:hypothetical protein
LDSVIKACQLPVGTSAQKVELVVLTRHSSSLQEYD